MNPEAGASADATEAVDTTIPILPEKVGPYAIHALLAKGGSSMLYLGLDPDSQQLLAIKTLHPRLASKGDVVNRFLHESNILKKAEHPHIVRRVAQGRWDQGFYMAMEYFPGLALRSYLLHSALSLTTGLKILLKVCEAVEHLHSLGIVHRDIKPENILVSDEGDVRLIDLGIAHQIDEKRAQESPEVMGTPFYMSPEQRNDPQAVSFASDIYSLGILTYELALGRLCKGNVHLSLLPKGLQGIVAKSLQALPSQRHRSVQLFAQEIAQYLQAPPLARERHNEDQLRILAEQVNRKQRDQRAQIPSDWDRMHIGISSHIALNASAVSYDFLELPQGNYAIVLLEAPQGEGEGLWDAMYLRGMLQAVAPLTSDITRITALLNELVYNDPHRQTYRLSMLLLEPSASQLRYVSFGQNPLWQLRATSSRAAALSATHQALGVDPEVNVLATSQSWQIGDLLFLCSRTLYTPEPLEGERPICKISEPDFEKQLFASRYWPRHCRSPLLFHGMAPSTAQGRDYPSSALMVIERMK